MMFKPYLYLILAIVFASLAGAAIYEFALKKEGPTAAQIEAHKKFFGAPDPKTLKGGDKMSVEF